MKIRSGFVSNSSSSSFCIFGKRFVESDLEKGFEDYWEFLEYLDDLFPNLSVSGDFGAETYVHVGESLTDMKDDETFLEFKHRVHEEIKKVYPKTDFKELKIYEESGMM